LDQFIDFRENSELIQPCPDRPKEIRHDPLGALPDPPCREVRAGRLCLWNDHQRQLIFMMACSGIGLA
jgi:hypothetical protein